MGQVLPVILATAGHVDHGKTALVRALTGCDTDRLPQEKERGLSIDLGFALCQLDGDNSIGIVDLPGHVDFISNMVAGAASAKIVLLVVAADESVMAQTREHLEIISQLTSARIMVVVTKIDRVDEEVLEVVKNDALALLAEFGLQAEGVYYTSIKTFSGLSALRESILQVAMSITGNSDERGFRLFVERTFLVKGYGRVVTGIAVSGSVEIGSKFRINNSDVRVRGLQSHGNKQLRAAAGYCMALNIDALSATDSFDDIKRGCGLYDAKCYTGVDAVIVAVNNICVGYTFKRNTNCRVHIGTMVCNASLRLFAESELGAAQQCFGHLKLDRPEVLAAGDRFLLRVASPYGNVGGGVVLAVGSDYRLRRKDHFRLNLFEQAYFAVLEKDYFLSEILAGKDFLLTSKNLCLLSHMHLSDALQEVERLVEAGALCKLSESVWIVTSKIGWLALEFQRNLKGFHEKYKFKLGMDWEQVAALFGIGISAVPLLLELVCEYIEIQVNTSNKFVALKDYFPALQGRSLDAYHGILDIFNCDSASWIAIGEMREKYGLNKEFFRELVQILTVEIGVVVVAGGKYMISRVEYERLAEVLEDAFLQVDIIDISFWRKISGLSRNHGVAILEYFDMLNITRRVDAGRKKVDT